MKGVLYETWPLDTRPECYRTLVSKRVPDSEVGRDGQTASEGVRQGAGQLFFYHTPQEVVREDKL